MINGTMSGGFALVAWPAKCDSTGVMTFVVNQDGTIREKNSAPIRRPRHGPWLSTIRTDPGRPCSDGMTAATAKRTSAAISYSWGLMKSATAKKVRAGSAPRADRTTVRTGLGSEAIAEALIDNLHYIQAKLPEHATRNDWYMALAYAVRDRMLGRYMSTVTAIGGREPAAKIVAYLSAEFLTGPHLGNSLINLGIWNATEKALASVGQSLPDLLAQEEEPGLGNGGLGRLAACYMDSLATLNVPAIGYGIRYEFGIFDQEIRDGWQVEHTDKWLRFGNPWEIVDRKSPSP